jgi:hypothetical protein
MALCSLRAARRAKKETLTKCSITIWWLSQRPTSSSQYVGNYTMEENFCSLSRCLKISKVDHILLVIVWGILDHKLKCVDSLKISLLFTPTTTSIPCHIVLTSIFQLICIAHLNLCLHNVSNLYTTYIKL